MDLYVNRLLNPVLSRLLKITLKNAFFIVTFKIFYVFLDMT